MRIILFNVKYSPNLGDGLLSECLEAEFRRQRPSIFVQSIDLAGRDRYGSGWQHRRTALAALERLPWALRQIVTGIALRRAVSRTLAPRCRAAMVTTDAVVLGGGNLLADADLNFPIKIACALGTANDAGRPVGVFGIGVSDNWSRRGTALFGDALATAKIVHAGVRDERSKAIWDRALTDRGIPAATLCRDPGLLTSRHFPAAPRVAGRVGLCLTNPLALRYHGAAHADRRLDAWLVALAEQLAASHDDITLFTNGSPEDREYLTAMVPRLRAVCGDRLAVAPGFGSPADLAAFVSTCAIVVAHRMHACIAAYSYAVPHVGLAWDPKLDSFFTSVGRAGYMVDPTNMSAAEAARLVTRALAEGIDPAAHSAVVADAVEDVARLYASLAAAVIK